MKATCACSSAFTGAGKCLRLARRRASSPLSCYNGDTRSRRLILIRTVFSHHPQVFSACYQVRCRTGTFPFRAARFSFILFNEVFEHLRIDPIATLAEIRRVLRPGGSLVLSTPNLYSLKSIASFLRGRGFDDPYREFHKLHSLGHMGHVRVYTAHQIRTFLSEAGFRNIETRYQFHKSSRRFSVPR